MSNAPVCCFLFADPAAACWWSAAAWSRGARSKPCSMPAAMVGAPALEPTLAEWSERAHRTHRRRVRSAVARCRLVGDRRVTDDVETNRGWSTLADARRIFSPFWDAVVGFIVFACVERARCRSGDLQRRRRADAGALPREELETRFDDSFWRAGGTADPAPRTHPRTLAELGGAPARLRQVAVRPVVRPAAPAPAPGRRTRSTPRCANIEPSKQPEARSSCRRRVSAIPVCAGVAR